MVERPASWKNHYHGDESQLRLLRRYALSDRSRYYWGEADVQAALARLVENLQRHAPPLILLSQFMPAQHDAIVAGDLSAQPLALIRHKVAERLAEYARACAHNRAGVRGA